MEPSIYVALLRGINVGGKNKLPMTDLVNLFTELGCSEVKSHIQSGNIIFRANKTLANRVPKLIVAGIVNRFGYQVPVVLRSADALREVNRNNPFLKSTTSTDALHVAFLAGLPKTANLAALDPKRSPPDRFVVHGREIYLRLPNGVAKTRLTNAYFDSKLATTSTVRNWNTFQKLLDLTKH